MFKAEVLTDSIHPDNDSRATTMLWTFPRIILPECLTHRTHSRNTASSRAIPALKAIERVEKDPFIPIHFGKNQKGMQAGEEITGEDRDECVNIWLTAMQDAVDHAKDLHDKGVHKQIVNRIIEPYSWTTMILTACGSGWRNLFALRCHPAAEPHFQKIAFMAREVYNASTPRELAVWEWHLPLVGFPGDEELSSADRLMVSVGRCARVSYLTHDGRRDPEEDIRLHDRLMNENPKHMSAFEHQLQCASGYPLSDDYRGNMETGWIQYRKQIIGERAE